MRTTTPDKSRLHPKPKHLLLVGLIANVAIFSIPLVRHIFNYYAVVIHELGHTLTAWAFGYPAIPTFNLVHGGGVTISFGVSRWLQAGILSLMGFYCWRWLKAHQGRLPIIMPLFWMAYLTLLIGESWHQALITFMGQAGEPFGAMLCCYLALSPYSTQSITNKYLLIILGIFTYANSIEFCYAINFSAAFQAHYFDMDRGLISDFVKLRDSTGWPIGFSTLLLLMINTLTLYWLIKLLQHYRYNVFRKTFQDFKNTLLARR